jgi:hypothetical protein
MIISHEIRMGLHLAAPATLFIISSIAPTFNSRTPTIESEAPGGIGAGNSVWLGMAFWETTA